MAEKHYVTTPIYYVNFKPHIGTSYTTILADVACRFQRMLGKDTLLVTGSDEHSQNISDLAHEAGKSPRQWCDEMVPKFHQLWDDVNIQNYRFERTSSAKHHQLVQTFWQRVYDKGDVYKGEYCGWYHTSDNRFLDEDEVPEHPEDQPRLKFLREESYFFKLGKYESWLMDFHNANPQFILPNFRRKEMLNRIQGGLKDICISRTSTDWGIPLPWDSGHVFYVWIEALLTYMTGSGFDIEAFEQTFGADGKSSEVREPIWDTRREDLVSQPDANYWPCDLHTMAIDIPWFHAVIWPAMLCSYGAPPPKQELVHGYWNFDGEKMSKSLGNVVDPYDAIKIVGVDGLRYFLMREVPVGLDGSFNYEALVNRFNFDLANDLGNLVHRTVSMLHQNFEGKMPEVLEVSQIDDDVWEKALHTRETVATLYAELKYSEALQEIWNLIGEANKYIEDKRPWELRKKPERKDELSTVFNRLINIIRYVLLLAYPVIPGSAMRFWEILNFEGQLGELGLEALDTPIPAGLKTNVSKPVFQRIDKHKLGPTPKDSPGPKKADAELESAKDKPGEAGNEFIKYDDFIKVELRTATVISAEKVENTDRLLKLIVDDGVRKRQIIAGVAEYYKPDELVGKSITIVANLKPRKLRGLLSEGMVLAVKDDVGLSLVTTDRPVKPGFRLS